MATARVVAQSRAALYRDDAVALGLPDGRTAGPPRGESRPVTDPRADDHHRGRLAIQNASRNRLGRAARCVGRGWTSRREHDHATAREEPLFVAVALDLPQTQ